MSLGGLLFWIVVAVGVYAGIMMALPQVRNYQVKELFRTEVNRLKVASEGEIRKLVHKQLKEMGIQLIPEETLGDDGLHIIIEAGKPAIMEATYSTTVHFIKDYNHTYTFHVRMESKAIVNPK